MQYVVNGTVFDDVKEAEKYEEELKIKEEEKKNKDKEKDERFKELKDLEKEYVDKVNKFYKDYGHVDIDLRGLPNSIDNFFDVYWSDFFKR